MLVRFQRLPPPFQPVHDEVIMTKRIQLDEIPYRGIGVGEKVMYLGTSGRTTFIDYGFYRGTHGFIPVVESFSRERKWVIERGRYVQSKQWTIRSRRVYLYRGRIFNLNRVKEMLDIIPTYDDIARLIEPSPE